MGFAVTEMYKFINGQFFNIFICKQFVHSKKGQARSVSSKGLEIRQRKAISQRT